MVLMNEIRIFKWMRIGIAFLLFLPLLAKSQEERRNPAETPSMKYLETTSLPLIAAPETQLHVSLLAQGNNFVLRVSGMGAVAHTINTGDPVIFLLKNDSTVTLKATAVQGYDELNAARSFKHDYVLPQTDLEMLSRNKVQALRKYSVVGYDEFLIDETVAASLQNLCVHFLQTLDKERLLKKIVVTEPSFPGGKAVFLTFINRNLKPLPLLRPGERKTALVQFRIDANGSMQQPEIRQSAGKVYDTELLRILQRMPRWKPARSDGKRIPMTVSLPVTFYQEGEVIRAGF